MSPVSHSSVWRGVHVLAERSSSGFTPLIGQVPALAELGVNVLVVEIDYNYAYSSHPKLRMSDPTTPEQAHALVKACREYGIRVIPQFQALGHQSWAEFTFPLLVQYPQFDETPGQYPDNKGIYCRSWCPQHPQVNPIIFDLFDELLDAFEADALHVGMDETFLIASEYCPRCKGGDPAALYATAINDYHAHLVGKRGVEMLMWADRLIPDRTTGYGEWEASRNGTDPAMGLIPKDIILCDWHYTLRDEYPSIPLFLEQGFRVWPSGWREVPAVEALIDYSRRFEDERVLGYLCTTWGAVKSGELAAWPPLVVAMSKLT